MEETSFDEIMPGLMATVQEKINNSIKFAELLASEEPFDESIYEEFDPYSRYGGNMDDAYYAGVEHGRQQLADEIKELLK